MMSLEGDILTCYECYKSCKTCSAENDQNACLTCMGSYYFYEN